MKGEKEREREKEKERERKRKKKVFISFNETRNKSFFFVLSGEIS